MPRDSYWRGALLGGLVVLSIVVGAGVEFVQATWRPWPGIGVARLITWSATAVVIWFAASSRTLGVRAAIAAAPSVLLIALFLSPWPQPRKEFFRDVASLSVGMPRDEVLHRLRAHEVSPADEVLRFKGHHIARIIEDQRQGLGLTYAVTFPSTYNGLIGDSDHGLLVFEGARLREVSPLVD